MITELPSKLSDLLALALNDLKAVEADPNYTVDMKNWHRPDKDVCAVCLAGAVMAKSLGVARDNSSNPDFFGKDVGLKLLDLDSLRCGVVPNDMRLSRNVHSYRENPQAWREDMVKLHTDLVEAGL